MMTTRHFFSVVMTFMFSGIVSFAQNTSDTTSALDKVV